MSDGPEDPRELGDKPRIYLDAIRERLGKATPGPWRVEGHGMVWASNDHWVTVNPTDADADLIAHAPADLALLVAVAEAAQTLLENGNYLRHTAADERALRAALAPLLADQPEKENVGG